MPGGPFPGKNVPVDVGDILGAKWRRAWAGRGGEQIRLADRKRLGTSYSWFQHVSYPSLQLGLGCHVQMLRVHFSRE